MLNPITLKPELMTSASAFEEVLPEGYTAKVQLPILVVVEASRAISESNAWQKRIRD